MKTSHVNKINKNSKNELLISTSYNLFMLHGIKRISVEEICIEAGISKMTFYKYFKNKKELAKFVLEKAFNDQMDIYRNIMKEKISFSKKIEKIILLKHNSTQFISEAFFKDLIRNPNQEISEMLTEFRNNTITEITNDFRKAKKKGEIRKNININFLIYILNTIQEMTKDEKLTSLYKNPNELIMELTNFFFYGILPIEKGKK